jgi:hypothetical protein
MLSLFWRIGGIDPQLIARCPPYERWRYLSLSVLIAVLGGMLSVATIYLAASTNLNAPTQDILSATVEWGQILMIAFVAFIMNLSIYRLAICSTMSHLQVPRAIYSDRGFWGSLVIRIVLVTVFGAIFGSAICYRVLGQVGSGELSIAQRNYLNKMVVDKRGPHGEPISDLYIEQVGVSKQLAKLRKPYDVKLGTPRPELTEQELAQIAEIEVRLDELSLAISDSRARSAETRRIRERELAASQGIAITIEREFAYGPGLCILIYCMSIGLYAIPLVLLYMGTNGPYLYLVAFQNVLALGRNKIIPEANFVWFGSKKHTTPRFLAAEQVSKLEDERLNCLRRENQKKLYDFYKEFRSGGLGI